MPDDSEASQAERPSLDYQFDRDGIHETLHQIIMILNIVKLSNNEQLGTGKIFLLYCNLGSL